MWSRKSMARRSPSITLAPRSRARPSSGTKRTSPTGVAANTRPFGIADHEGEGLRLGGADRHDQPPSGAQLLDQRRGHGRAGGRDHDGVERRVGAPAERAVAVQHGDVGEFEVAQHLVRPVGQLGDAFDGKDRLRQHREQRRLVSRSGADFQHPLAAGEAEQLAGARLDERLRDRLAIADRERGVVVGLMVERFGHEAVPGNGPDGAQHGHVVHALAVQRLHQLRAVSGESVAHVSLRAASCARFPAAGDW